MVTIVFKDEVLETNSETIKYTKQVNDIAELETRQTSFTSSFDLPKTPQITQAFEQLGIVGDTSKVPYLRNDVQLYDNGTPLIYKGWLNVIETNAKGYKCNIYDGAIDLFKAIENKTFGENTDLTEINHEKNLNTVINSFNNPNYRYIINDYGGKTHTDNGTKINIDYLIPSVNVKYLWDKIFTTFGFNYIGDIFNHIDFTGLWLTYPKGISISDIIVDNYADLKSIFLGSLLMPNNIVNPFYRTWNTLNTVTNGSLINNFFYVVPETGSYEIKYKANGSTRYRLKHKNIFILFKDTEPEPYRLVIRINTVHVFEFFSNDTEFTQTINLNAGDIIDYEISSAQENFMLFPEWDILNFFDFLTLDEVILKINKYNTAISFSDELKNLKITDFFKEILNRFALTIFIDKDNNYIFKTFNERLQSDVIDWTDKYKERTSETYTPKSYAQVNYFRHKYNDDDSNYNNGKFLIDNKNLKDNTEVLSSFAYSTEKYLESFFINNSFNEIIYPTLLWDKEISENTGTQTIKYKSLSNRFYFLRLENITQNSILRSETLLVEQSITSFPAARFYMTLYKDFVPKYYSNIRLLLNDFRLHKMKINLSCIDVHNLDFDKLYYFNQEANYYILNKLDYESNKDAKAEFIRIKYAEQ